MASATTSDEENDRLTGERENNDLVSATNETSSIIVELSLQAPIHVRWVSQSWQDIIGTNPSTLVGKAISDFIADDSKTLFSDATRQVLEDDSSSVRLRFWLAVPGDCEIEHRDSKPSDSQSPSATAEYDVPEVREAVELDANGILIHDRMSGEPTHTMWVFTIVQDNQELVDGTLDQQLAKALLSGTEFLVTYLQQLSSDPSLPAPAPLTCNICDRQIQPWFFEKHTALCIVSHKAESEVQDCHDHLRDHRQVISEFLAQLQRAPIEPTHSQKQQTPMTVTSAVNCTTALSQISTSNPRTRSIKEKKVCLRAVELILDVCDLAIDISTPAIPEDDNTDLFGRIQSPDSRSRISQLTEWNPPPSDDPSIFELCGQTQLLIAAKISAVTRLHNTIHYSEKIRQEIDARVQDLIDQVAEDALAAIESDLHESLSSDFLQSSTTLGIQEAIPSDAVKQSATESLVFREPFSLESHAKATSPRPAHTTSPVADSNAKTESVGEQVPRSSSPLAQFSPVHQNSFVPKPPSLLNSVRLSGSSANSVADGSSTSSRRNSPQDLDSQIREMRISRGIYESPRRPSGGSRPPTGFSPSRRGSRAVSRSRATSLARDRTVSPGRKALNARLNLIERDRLSPTGSPTLSATESLSTEASYRDRRISNAPPLSPRLPSIAPAARPAPPSIKDFDIIKPISKGAFGSVYLSKKRTTGDYYAIKVLKKADMIAKNQVTNIKAERAIMMAQTESPFIAKLFFTFQSKEYLYLVMEYLNGGDCGALIKQLGGLPEDWTKRYMAEVVLGLEYLHSRGIIHRDLKPDNLLISHNGHLKLTDFGLSRVGLVGRQNRARTASHADAPDLLNVHSRSSPSSSRSASFDFQSGISTPAIAPMSISDSRAGYFNLRDRKASNSSDILDNSRGEGESITSVMSRLNLDESRYDSDDSISTASGHSGTVRRPTQDNITRPSTSGSIQTQMPPPAMKLFDPKDEPRKFVGTPDYLAPETINGSGQDDMVDWWSLGVIMFEFLYGYPPFHASTPDAVFQNILTRRIDWPSVAEDLELGISDAAKVAMESLMVLDPAERLGSQNGAGDVKSQAFFETIIWDKISEEEALFVPTPDHPEDTDYFDARGATNHVFEDESNTPLSSDGSPVASDKDKPNKNPDTAFSKRIANSNRQILKRSVMPLSIPPHVRDRKHRNRRLSESGMEDFGTFTFKNLSVLEKQNQEALRRLKTEHGSTNPMSIPRDPTIAHHQRSASTSGASQARRSLSAASSLSSTPISPVSQGLSLTRATMPSSPLTSVQPIQRTLSKSKTKPGSSFSVGLGLQISDRIRTPQSPTSQESPTKTKIHASSLPGPDHTSVSTRSRAFTVGAENRPELPFEWSSVKRISRVFEPETPSSSSDTESPSGVKALQRVQRRRQRSKRLSSISLSSGNNTIRSHRPLDILICEDNPVSRKVLEAMLSKLKCRVVSVIDGAQAVAAATADVVFDIIFTDIKVPRLSGVEVARLVKSTSGNNSKTPIVAMSSYSTADFKEIAQYFEKRLEKPLTISTISETIQDLICDWCGPQVATKKTTPQS